MVLRLSHDVPKDQVGGDPEAPTLMNRKVVVNDRMQRGYLYYCTEPVGRTFAPQFAPQLSPKQMLRLGGFGGKYMTDCGREFPSGWFLAASSARSVTIPT